MKRSIVLLFFAVLIQKFAFVQCETSVRLPKEVKSNVSSEIMYTIVHEHGKKVVLNYKDDDFDEYVWVIDTIKRKEDNLLYNYPPHRIETIETKESIGFDTTFFILNIIPMDSGVVEISGIKYSCNEQSDTLPTISFEIIPDFNDNVDDIVKIEINSPKKTEKTSATEKQGTPWWIYLISSILGLGILSGVFYWYWKRTRKEQVLTAYEFCLQAIEDLEKNKLWEKDVKDFYTKLSNILRIYVSSELDVLLMEKTTAQCSILLQEKLQEKSLIKDILDNLNLSDLVKFAGSKPDLETVEMSLNKIKEIATRINEIYHPNE